MLRESIVFRHFYVTNIKAAVIERVSLAKCLWNIFIRRKVVHNQINVRLQMK